MAGLVEYLNGATPSTPGAGYMGDYSKTADKRRYTIDENGAETCLMDPRPVNKLYNPSGDVFKRIATNGSTNIGNNTYAQDRWLLLTNGASGDIQVSQIAGPTTPFQSKFGIQLKQTNAAAKNLGQIQWLNSYDSIPLRGRRVCFQINNVNGANIRIAVLSWTGTADTLGAARDPINAWANAADANPATTFFKSTTMTVDGYTAASSATGVMSCVTGQAGNSGSAIVYANINANANNVAVVVWSSTTVVQNATFQYCQAMLTDGAVYRDYVARKLSEEEQLCDAFCQTSFSRGTAPAQSAGANTGELQYSATKTVGGTNQTSPKFTFGTRMWKTPAMTFYNPSAANAQVRDETAGGDCSATATVSLTETGFSISCTGNGGGAIADVLGVHWLADAEL
jgi:hypothetical protein